jgi:glycosyltransferase involved in cell wall biosynthesis
MTKPLVQSKAVISVPFYNEASFLEETLECLLNVPGGVPVKFFLCDNATDDGSSDIATRYAEKDDRFVYHRHDKNIGAFSNFQFAYEQADCDYFMWLGAHDLIDGSYPAAAIKLLDDNNDFSYACADMKAFETDISQAAPMKGALYDFHDDRLVRYLQSVAKLANCTIVNTMFRHECLKDYNWQNIVSWDHSAISRILWHGKVGVTKGHYYYRRALKKAVQQGNAQKEAALPRIDFIEHYARDFCALYEGPETIKTHLSVKIIGLLEQRFGIPALNPIEKI